MIDQAIADSLKRISEHLVLSQEQMAGFSEQLFAIARAHPVSISEVVSAAEAFAEEKYPADRIVDALGVLAPVSSHFGPNGLRDMTASSIKLAQLAGLTQSP